eukprot:3594194-Pyramimonas_sp.AAC.1
MMMVVVMVLTMTKWMTTGTVLHITSRIVEDDAAFGDDDDADDAVANDDGDVMVAVMRLVMNGEGGDVDEHDHHDDGDD